MENQLHDNQSQSFIEYQINKNVDDLDMLQFIIDFYIKENEPFHLNNDMMLELCDSLLKRTKLKCYSFPFSIYKKPTKLAIDAFIVFSFFLQKVPEFFTIVNNKPIDQLCSDLNFHYHLQTEVSNKQKEAVHIILTQLSINDKWQKEYNLSSQKKKKNEQEKDRNSINHSKVVLYPPHSLYAEFTRSTLLKMYPYTDINNGISTSLSYRHLEHHYGKNRLPPTKKPSVLKTIWHQLTDFMVIMLLIASIVEGAQQDFNSMAILLVVVVLNTVIGFTQEWKANKALDGLNHLNIPQAQVIRDGNTQLIPSEQLVPGDVIILEEGDMVPADVRLMEASQLEIIESILTGESLPVQKSTDSMISKNLIMPTSECLSNAFMSTVVARGRGKGIVVRTGSYTEIGKISSVIQNGSEKKAKTHIQRKLDKLGKNLVLLAIILCIIIIIIGIIWKKNAQEMINVGLSLAVSVIPEGLVAVTTVTMALGVHRMSKKQCIIRTLPAVESLGSVTVICSDKTGTLTVGDMMVTKLWTSDGTHYDFTNSESIDQQLKQQRIKHSTSSLNQFSYDSDHPASPSTLLEYAMMISALCNNAVTKFIPETKETKSIGDPTEIALLIAAEKLNLGPSLWTSQYGCKKYQEKAFDSDRKLMSILYTTSPLSLSPTLSLSRSSSSSSLLNNDKMIKQDQENHLINQDNIMVCKGAPEEVLKKCTKYIINDQIQFIDDEFQKSVLNQNHQFASQGLRVLGLAMKCSTHSPSFVISSPTLFSPTLVSQQESCDYSINDNGTISSSSSSSSSSTPCYIITQNNNNNNNNYDQHIINDQLKKDDDDDNINDENFFSEQDLIFIGLIGMVDPPKKGVYESIVACQEAGIQVTMITGDHITTATAIASQLGIYDHQDSSKNNVINGQELDLIPMDILSEMEPFPSVFARVSPDNKLKIIQALQKKGEIVAMTGDGVNDAAAIKHADVGVAMGSGTEITKQAADVILLDNSFLTIVSAIEEGRHVFDNILKFMVYLLSCNCAEIFLMLICSIINLEMPLTVMMLLWANIIADIPPSMAIGIEPKEIGLMKRPPRSPQRAVITKVTWIIILLQSFLIASMTIIIYVLAIYVFHYPLNQAQTLAFTTLTTLQLVQSFYSRSISQSIFKTGIVNNRWLIYSFIISFSAMIIGIYAPGISNWLELTYINSIAWAMIFICCIIQFILVETGKCCIRYWNCVV
ncbi:unnamed protein product [Cunninghamella blakesleeana]